jgi:hypothetical protein
MDHEFASKMALAPLLRLVAPLADDFALGVVVLQKDPSILL